MRISNVRASAVVIIATVLLASCASDDDSRISVKPPVANTKSNAAADDRDSAPAPAQGKFHVLFPDASGADRVAGYRHRSGQSRFRRGAQPPQVDSSVPYIRSEKTEKGVFFEYENGFATGIPHGDDIFAAGPYSKDSTAHTARVLTYFKGAGLPEDQISGASINTWMAEGGRTMDVTPSGELIAKFVTEKKELLGFVTIVERSIDGVRVADSFAWAMFNADDDAVYEQVWWPELRGTIRADLAAFRGRLAEPQFLKGLPVQGDGVLRIHHATPTGETWYSTVTYDVRPAGDQEEHHFDINGVEVHPLAWKIDGL